MRLKINNTEHRVMGVYIENGSGPMYFAKHCGDFAGYGRLVYFIDSLNHKHIINQNVAFNVIDNHFFCYTC